VLRALIGNDDDMYAWFLRTVRDRKLHLVPLQRNVESIRIDSESIHISETRIKFAVEAGHSASSVMDAIFENGHGWYGSASKHYGEWIHAFESISKSDDPKVRRVGRLGMRRARSYRKHALAGERHDAVYGR
jgi:hypothetical protein